MATRSSGRTREHGQASVELLALLPLVALLAALAWQAVVAGQAVWLVGSAAREAARARALGGDPAVAARRALPSRLERGLRVARDADGGVRVRVVVPALVRGVDVGTVAARARMEPQA